MVNEKFNELLAKELSGEISPEERQEFLQLIEQNDTFKQEFDLLKLYWNKTDTSINNDKDLFARVESKIYLHEQTENENITATAPAISIEPKPLNFKWLRIAAMLLLALSISLYVVKRSVFDSAQENMLVKTTPKGSKTEMVLADGTKVTLNAGSELKYPENLNGKTREVYLNGEAFFDVHHDKEHPFIIHTSKMDVCVLGTAFNVKAYANEKTYETTLIRGSVKITLLDRPADAIILKPNEKLVLNNTTLQQATAQTKPAAPVKASSNEPQYAVTTLTYLEQRDSTVVETSWMKHKLILSDEDFESTAKRLERWYNVDIEFADDQIKQYRFTASFENETIQEVLQALQLTENFHYKLDKSTVRIYK